MGGLRQALLFASGGRYVVMGMGLVSTVIIARLLTPADFGISVLGTAILGIAEALRELGSVAYLVQQTEITEKKTRTVFTISLIVTLVLASLLIMLSGSLAHFYNEPRLSRYIQIVALSYAIAPFVHPIYALLSRNMAFHTIAMLDIATSLLNTISAVGLVFLGFGYTALAWAAVISSAAWAVLGLFVWRDFSIYRPSLSEWRSVFAFGAYGSATAVLYRASESIFYLILGRLLDARAVGLCQRALLLAQFPERVILAGIGAVALPAFSGHARRGQDLKISYLRAIEHVTAIQWPALILLGVLADPIVSVLLGPQWPDVIPVMRIFVVALLFNFPSSLNYPVQVAAGAIRHTVLLAFVQATVSLGVLSFAARYGMLVLAWSTCATGPFNVGLSVWLVRRHMPFRWWEFGRALEKSATVTLLSAIGPASIAIAWSSSTDLPIALICAAVISSGVGWFGGLWMTRHPLFQELCDARLSIGDQICSKLCVGRLRPNEHGRP